MVECPGAPAPPGGAPRREGESGPGVTKPVEGQLRQVPSGHPSVGLPAEPFGVQGRPGRASRRRGRGGRTGTDGEAGRRDIWTRGPVLARGGEHFGSLGSSSTMLSSRLTMRRSPSSWRVSCAPLSTTPAHPSPSRSATTTSVRSRCEFTTPAQTCPSCFSVACSAGEGGFSLVDERGPRCVRSAGGGRVAQLVQHHRGCPASKCRNAPLAVANEELEHLFVDEGRRRCRLQRQRPWRALGGSTASRSRSVPDSGRRADAYVCRRAERRLPGRRRPAVPPRRPALSGPGSRRSSRPDVAPPRPRPASFAQFVGPDPLQDRDRLDIAGDRDIEDGGQQVPFRCRRRNTPSARRLRRVRRRSRLWSRHSRGPRTGAWRHRRSRDDESGRDRSRRPSFSGPAVAIRDPLDLESPRSINLEYHSKYWLRPTRRAMP